MSFPLKHFALMALLLFTALNTSAQTNDSAVRSEQLRGECIQGRRCICGRVLQVLTNGIVLESGFANLLRPELKGDWHFPSTVVATRDPHLVEDKTPGSICVGPVFLTDLPRKRRAKIKINQYEYVVLNAYPAGSITYTSPENIPHTVRRFACGLESAVQLRLDSSDKSN